jgi:DNA-binding NarL/FixJ family response regulator
MPPGGCDRLIQPEPRSGVGAALHDEHAELDSNEALVDTVDIALYDAFAQPESDHEEIAVLVANPRARRVVVYTWNFHPDLIHSARQQGAHGYLSIARAVVGRVVRGDQQ